jgi:hypothetical protein
MSKESKKMEEKSYNLTSFLLCLGSIITFFTSSVFFTSNNFVLGIFTLGVSLILFFLMPLNEADEDEDDYYSNWI